MKVINRMIRRTIAEIVLVIAFVIISIPVWNSLNLEEYASLAMYYDNMSYNYLDVSDYSDYMLYQTNDEAALENIKPINLKLSNASNTNEDYAVWMIVSKTSTLSNETVKINIDNETKRLVDLEKYEDEEYYYFLLFDGNLGSSVVNKEVILWLDIESQEDISGKYLSFEFENIQRQML